jgi:hypothetical protein
MSCYKINSALLPEGEEIEFSLAPFQAQLLLRSIRSYLGILEFTRQELSQFYTEVISLRGRNAHKNGDLEEKEAIEMDEIKWCEAANREWNKIRKVSLLLEKLQQCVRGKL